MTPSVIESNEGTVSDIPADLRYTAAGTVGPPHRRRHRRVGITDFAQSSLGDVVYDARLPDVSAAVTAGDSFEVESTKIGLRPVPRSLRDGGRDR